MYKILRSGLAALLSLIVTISVHAQETTSVLYNEIQDAEIKGLAFPQFELFHVISGDKHDVLRNETLIYNFMAKEKKLLNGEEAFQHFTVFFA